MKHVLVIALALASVNAFATRARVSALGNSAHLVDTQTVYSNPADMLIMGDYVNFESGTTAGGAENANASGMITRSMGDSKLGLALGHQSSNASIWKLRSNALTGLTAVSQQNPVNLSYGVKMGDMNIAGTLVYSNYNDKIANIKESSSGVRLGLRTGMWDAKLGLGLGNSFENAASKFKGTTGISAGVGYMMDDVYLNAFTELAGFKVENATTGAEVRKFDGTSITIGALKSHKKEGNELFYGIGLNSTSQKLNVVTSTTETKTTTMSLPITLGMEADAATWLTLRGSVTQSTVINSSKVESTVGTAPTSTTSETAPGLNNTVASVGAGLKFNKLTVDGTLQGLTGTTATQELNGNKLLGSVGVTYMF